MFDPKTFFNTVNPNKNIIVAYSGGVDSTAMLHFCYELHKKKLLLGNLSALHINHSLNTNSDLWEEHCQKFCEKRNIPFKSRTVEVSKKKSGLESAARQARYKIFTEVLKSNDQILLAHHADDVAETVLFRLFRGTGLDGLQGPMKKRYLGEGVLLRPWLDRTKSELIKYLSDHKIQHITDESNFNDDQDRNFIRNELMELISGRWPSAPKQIQQTSELIFKHKKTYDILLEQKFGSQIKGLKLDRKFLLDLDESTCIEIIRYWIKKNNVAMPNKKILGEILKAFIYSKPSAITRVNWSRADNEQKKAFLTFSDGDLVLNEK